MSRVAADPPTSVTVPRSVLAELRLVKAEMSRDEGATIALPEVVSRLIACWREQQRKEARRV